MAYSFDLIVADPNITQHLDNRNGVIDSRVGCQSDKGLLHPSTNRRVALQILQSSVGVVGCCLLYRASVS